MTSEHSEVARGSLTREQVDAYTDALTRHYGETVRPVSDVCRAIGDYVHALVQNKSDGPYGPGVGAAIREHGPMIMTFAAKSALLWRLIYAGEHLRTRKCPEHDGCWSGCASAELKCGCGDSADGKWGNITGWLKETRK